METREISRWGLLFFHSPWRSASLLLPYALAFLGGGGAGPFSSSSRQPACAVWVSFQPHGWPYRWLQGTTFDLTFWKCRGRGEKVLISFNESSAGEPSLCAWLCWSDWVLWGSVRKGMSEVGLLGRGGTWTKRQEKGWGEVIENCSSKVS